MTEQSRRLLPTPACVAWSVGAVALFVAVVALLTSAATHINVGTADGATVALEGQSISAGNLALHGWALSLDSFWTVDALFYAVAVKITGLHPGLLFVVPALLAALAIAVTTWLSTIGQSRRGGVAAVATVLVLLALPSRDLAYYLLQGPWHVGTMLFALVGFWAVARGRFDWAWVLAVVLMAAGMLGDLFMLAFGVVPVIVSGGVVARRCRDLRSGLPAVAAGVSAVALALVVRVVAQALGTFTLVNRNVPVKPSQLVANLRHVANRVGGMLGVNTIPFAHIDNGALGFRIVHLVGVVIVVCGAAVALGRLVVGVVQASDRVADSVTWRLEDLLVLATLADVVLFVAASPTGNLEFTKYISPAVVFSVLLGARVVGQVVDRLPAPTKLATLGLVGALVASSYAVEFALSIRGAALPQPAVALGRFLEAHDLREGVGAYWAASLVNLETDGAVSVRPVEANGDGVLVRFSRQSDAAWYDGSKFSFLVFDTARPWKGVDAASGAKTFGRPTHVYVVGTYRVLTWGSAEPVSSIIPPSGSPLQILVG